jgi:acyl-homoserine lactone synthase
MIFVVDAENREQFATDLAAMHRQRKAVFVDRAGWALPIVADQEIDRYDLLADTMYLLAKDEPGGQVLASARVITTTGPHLMQDLFPASFRATIPSGPTVWEASRYCTAPGLAGRSKRLSLLWETICGILETALEHRVDQVIFAANRALLPLALKCGWTARTAGPTITDGNDNITPVAAAITEADLYRVRHRHHVADTITRLAPPARRSDVRRDVNDLARSPIGSLSSSIL